jgi:hypothetical protein
MKNKFCCSYVQGFKESQICHNPDHNILLSDSGKDVLPNKSMKRIEFCFQKLILRT